MAMIVHQHGRGDILRGGLGGSISGAILRLFSNNITPAETDTVSAFTETTFTGYSAITLGTSPTVSDASPATATYAGPHEFTSSAGSQSVTVYGAYINRATGSRIIASERFPSSFTIVNNGEKITVPNVVFSLATAA